MSNILRPCPVSTRQFHYEAARTRFVGDISSTHGFGRVYNDACDEGLTLVSARTGREVTFVVNREHRNADGDITHWELIPAHYQRDVPPCHILLFND